jgi:hypothetical protein
MREIHSNISKYNKKTTLPCSLIINIQMWAFNDAAKPIRLIKKISDMLDEQAWSIIGFSKITQVTIEFRAL